jgi:heat-inducible transcriptional repressor
MMGMAQENSALNAEELTPRQREILGIVVHSYIRDASPVGSRTIADDYELGVSSATIRNELSYLEELGLVMQPHTSAGRVPTEQGYRYFVAQLMQDSELSAAEKRMIRHQFYQARKNLDQWMGLTAAVLARTTHATSLVTAPQAPQARIKYIKLIGVSDTVTLVILVFHGSTVRQELLSLPQSFDQEILERISNKFNALFEGKNATEIKEIKLEMSPFEEMALARILDMMRIEDRQRKPTLYRDGLTELLAEPEFAEPTKVRQLVEVLEEGSLIEPLKMATRQGQGVQVIIGGEGEWAKIGGYSIILSPYGIRGQISGALGVLGPLRMRYPRAVSTVRYVSQLLSELVRDLY